MVARATALLEQVSEAADADTEFMEVIMSNTVMLMLKCKSARHNAAKQIQNRIAGKGKQNQKEINFTMSCMCKQVKYPLEVASI